MTANIFWRYILKKYLDDICPIKGASEKNAIFYFFSRHKLIGQHTKMSDFSDPPSCFFFANRFSNIWNIWWSPNINHKLLVVLHHLKKKWFFFYEKWVQNYHLLLIFEIPSISTLNPWCNEGAPSLVYVSLLWTSFHGWKQCHIRSGRCH